MGWTGARTCRRLLAALGFLFITRSHPGWAQAASLTARARLDPSAVSVLEIRDLSFGTVPLGLATTVDPKTSANAGKFEIHGTPGAEISITLTRPPSLTVGALAMPLSFGPQSACFRNRDQQPACSYFNPAGPLVTRLRARPFPDNVVMVWVGGTVTPGAAQFPGIYRGTITLTAAYTGN